MMRVGLMVLAAATAPAGDGARARPEVLQAAVACHAIGDPGERLACYDKAIAALDDAERTKRVVVLDQAQIQQTKRSLFGFSLPKLKLFTGGKDDDGEKGQDEPEQSELQATLTAFGHDADGRLTFTIDTDARWRQVDDRPTSRIKPGIPVKLHRASLGSYFATLGGPVPIRVVRVG